MRGFADALRAHEGRTSIATEASPQTRILAVLFFIAFLLWGTC
jgi:hypothetical protein